MAGLRRVNFQDVVPEYDDTDPDGYRAGTAPFGSALGASMMGASLYELPPGQSICPYHYEYPDEEWLVVVEGRVTVRHPGGEEALGKGDIVCFPPGPEGAHEVSCLGDETATRRHDVHEAESRRSASTRTAARSASGRATSETCS